MDQQQPSLTPRPRKRATRTAADAPTSAHQKAHASLPAPSAQRPAAPLVATMGWHELSEEQYHADPCPAPSLSSHTAMTVIGKSLLHAWRGHPRSPGFEPSIMGAAADRGSAAHALLFGGKPIEAIMADDYRSTAARDARDKARALGRIPLLSKEIEGLMAMVAPARERLHQLHDGPFLCEQSAIWRTGLGWRRARLDTLSPSRFLIVDYKTTEAAVDALSCERRIADMGLQIQAAAYVEAVERLHPELMGRVRFVFQWQEQKPPYALSPPIEMSEAFMSLGRSQWTAACHLWDQALKHNAFPGFSPHPHLACPPPWELSRWEERCLADPRMGEAMFAGASQ